MHVRMGFDGATARHPAPRAPRGLATRGAAAPPGAPRDAPAGAPPAAAPLLHRLQGAALAALAASALVLGPAQLPAALAADNASVGSCVLRNCQAALAGCLGDAVCLENLVCLQQCSGRPDETECQIKCGDKYDDKAIGVFNTCAVSEKKCVPQRVDEGESPEHQRLLPSVSWLEGDHGAKQHHVSRDLLLLLLLLGARWGPPPPPAAAHRRRAPPPPPQAPTPSPPTAPWTPPSTCPSSRGGGTSPPASTPCSTPSPARSTTLPARSRASCTPKSTGASRSRAATSRHAPPCSASCRTPPTPRCCSTTTTITCT